MCFHYPQTAHPISHSQLPFAITLHIIDHQQRLPICIKVSFPSRQNAALCFKMKRLGDIVYTLREAVQSALQERRERKQLALSQEPRTEMKHFLPTISLKATAQSTECLPLDVQFQIPNRSVQTTTACCKTIDKVHVQLAQSSSLQTDKGSQVSSRK